MRLHTAHFFNVDIALGACLNLLFFSKIFGISVEWVPVILLFNTVWIIYTADRLMDIRKNSQMNTPRHRLHKKYSKVLLGMAALLFVVNCILLTMIPTELLVVGGGMALFVGFYFWSLWLGWSVPKELIVALVYTIGISLVPILSIDVLRITDLLVMVQHFILAFINLLLISDYERVLDKQNNQPNLALDLNQKLSWVYGCFFVLFLVTGVLFLLFSEGWTIQIVLTSMMAIFLIILKNRSFFNKNERYRLVADFAFYLPGVMILIG